MHLTVNMGVSPEQAAAFCRGIIADQVRERETIEQAFAGLQFGKYEPEAEQWRKINDIIKRHKIESGVGALGYGNPHSSEQIQRILQYTD